MKNCLAISMRVTESSNYYELRNSLAFDYIEYFENMGFTIILIPNNTKMLKSYFSMFNIRAIVLSGGNNVDPKLYENKEKLDDVYVERDNTEYQLLKFGLKNEIPILGLCRGFHCINVFFGGSINHNIDDHVNINHPLMSTDTSLNGQIVNSYHNQGVTLNSMAKSLKLVALSEDGFVEAFRHDSAKILGLQWHPERRNSWVDKQIINQFFNIHPDLA